MLLPASVLCTPLHLPLPPGGPGLWKLYPGDVFMGGKDRAWWQGHEGAPGARTSALPWNHL